MRDISDRYYPRSPYEGDCDDADTEPVYRCGEHDVSIATDVYEQLLASHPRAERLLNDAGIWPPMK